MGGTGGRRNSCRDRQGMTNRYMGRRRRMCCRNRNRNRRCRNYRDRNRSRWRGRG